MPWQPPPGSSHCTNPTSQAKKKKTILQTPSNSNSWKDVLKRRAHNSNISSSILSRIPCNNLLPWCKLEQQCTDLLDKKKVMWWTEILSGGNNILSTFFSASASSNAFCASSTIPCSPEHIECSEITTLIQKQRSL